MAITEDFIYLSDVYGDFRDIMRITMTKDAYVNLNSSKVMTTGTHNETSEFGWSFELSIKCREFEKCGNLKVPIAIDRLKHAWIPKLRSSLNKNSQQKVQDD